MCYMIQVAEKKHSYIARYPVELTNQVGKVPKIDLWSFYQETRSQKI